MTHCPFSLLFLRILHSCPFLLLTFPSLSLDFFSQFFFYFSNLISCLFALLFFLQLLHPPSFLLFRPLYLSSLSLPPSLFILVHSLPPLPPLSTLPSLTPYRGQSSPDGRSPRSSHKEKSIIFNMKAVLALTAEAPLPPPGASSPSPSRDQDLPHGNSTHHATGSGSAIPSHLRNITHSSLPSSPLTPTPARATTGHAQLHRREEDPPLQRSLDASCKNWIHQNNYAEQLFSSWGHQNNTPQNYHDGNLRGGQGISNCYRSSTTATEDDNSDRRKKRHSLPASTTTTSFASVTATNTIPPTTPPPPIHITLPSNPIPPSSSPPPRTTTTTIPTTFTCKDRIIRSSTTPPRNPSETTTRTPSPMPSFSSNNNNNQAHRSIDVTGVDGSGMGGGGAGRAGAAGGSSNRFSISTQLQRSSTSRDAGSQTALAGLDGSSNNGSSVVGMNENAAWTGHARSTLLAGGSGLGGHWKSNTVLSSSSSSSTSASSLIKKYEPSSKSIDHSANTPAQQQQSYSGTINGSGLQQQSGLQSQPSSPGTATATATMIGSTFLQQNSNTTEMDTFSETHSGVIMTYPNASSSRQTNTTVNGPGCIGLSDFVQSLFSQSLASRLYTHRPRFSSVIVGSSSWSVMRYGVFVFFFLLLLDGRKRRTFDSAPFWWVRVIFAV